MKIISAVFFFLYPFALLGQINLNGAVKSTEGDILPMANILILPDSLIITSGTGGKFEVRISAGEKQLIISYTGYETLNARIFLQSDTTVAFRLPAKVAQLKEVIVNADRFSSEDIVQSTRMSTTTLTQKDIHAIPVLGGEADVIKTLQLLSGTVRGVEGSSDLFVRGGAADQNLILLDGAPIYNTSHLFGFLSVFNPSILDNVEAINGAFPAEYGGRLSSILNINSRAEVVDQTKISADIGLIASRLYVEQPLIKDKASFWLAGRRTYIDQVVKTIGEELPYFFYDVNGKLILQPSSKNKIEFSFYSGEDILDIFRDRNNDGDGFLTLYSSGNSSQSFIWTQALASRWVSKISLTRSAFRYNISNRFEENA
ncbi:MAG: TonB-dependent receptor, partial [Cyclobacteriaceae bacterium]